MVAPDGSVYIEAEAVNCQYDCASNSLTYYNDQLSLLQVRPGGGQSWTSLANVNYSGPDTAVPALIVGDAIPDGQGGVLAAWDKSYYGIPNNTVEAHVTDVGPAGLSDYT